MSPRYHPGSVRRGRTTLTHQHAHLTNGESRQNLLRFRLCVSERIIHRGLYAGFHHTQLAAVPYPDDRVLVIDFCFL